MSCPQKECLPVLPSTYFPDILVLEAFKQQTNFGVPLREESVFPISSLYFFPIFFAVRLYVQSRNNPGYCKCAKVITFLSNRFHLCIKGDIQIIKVNTMKALVNLRQEVSFLLNTSTTRGEAQYQRYKNSVGKHLHLIFG